MVDTIVKWKFPYIKQMEGAVLLMIMHKMKAVLKVVSGSSDEFTSPRALIHDVLLAMAGVEGLDLDLVRVLRIFARDIKEERV